LPHRTFSFATYHESLGAGEAAKLFCPLETILPASSPFSRHMQPRDDPKSFLLSKLARVTSPGRKFVPQIDGLRFVAVMAVVAYHILLFHLFHRGLADSRGEQVTFWLKTIFSAGHNGVVLFFAISGFIISIPFARQGLLGGPTVSLGGFYLRRVTRIEPPYVIQLVIMLALCAFVLRKLPSHPHLFHNPDWLRYALAHILSSLIYAHSLIFAGHAYPNFVLWSLEVEVQFYLLAPCFARVFFIRDRVKRRGTFLGLIVSGMLVSFLFSSHYRVWTSLAGNLQYFLLGFVFADLYIDGQLAQEPGDYKWDLAFVVAGALVVFGDGGISAVALPLACCVCFLAAFRGVLSVRFLKHPWVTAVGGMCYTIYLYHIFLISFSIKATEKLRVSNLSLDLLMQFVLITAIIVPASAFLFIFLEKPFMDRNWPAKFYEALGRATGFRSPRLAKTPDNLAPKE
jgi:peptidoglycan/LPS O-acetylase OafA/YrhL